MIELFVAFDDREKYLNYSMELPDAEQLLMNMQEEFKYQIACAINQTVFEFEKV